MNNTRRKALRDILDQLEALKTSIEDFQEEEQEAFDNLPEGLQDSEKGETMYNAIDNLESALSSLEEAQDYILEAV